MKGAERREGSIVGQGAAATQPTNTAREGERRGGREGRGGWKRVGAGRGAAQILLNPHNCDNGALFVISGATL